MRLEEPVPEKRTQTFKYNCSGDPRKSPSVCVSDLLPSSQEFTNKLLVRLGMNLQDDVSWVLHQDNALFQ